MQAVPSGWLEGGWRSQHQDCCRLGRPEGLDLVLLGDSLLQGWGGPGRKVLAAGATHWAHCFGARRAGNLGVAGDRVRHLAWRIEHGALADLDPRLVILLIGTNDLSDGEEPAPLAAAVLQLAREILEQSPRTRLQLHALLPRGAQADDPQRRAVESTNLLLAEGVPALGVRAEFVNHRKTFVAADGTLHSALFEDDALHLTSAGYAAWGEALCVGLEPPLPTFADGRSRALEPAWIRVEKTAGLLGVGAIFLGAALALAISTGLGLLEEAWPLVLTVAWVVLAPTGLWLTARWPHWEYPRTGYCVRPDRIEVWRGLLWRRFVSIPCARVQYTDVSQGPLQRRHGIATLQIHTAGTANAAVSVPGLPHALAIAIPDWLVTRTDDDAV